MEVPTEPCSYRGRVFLEEGTACAKALGKTEELLSLEYTVVSESKGEGMVSQVARR